MTVAQKRIERAYQRAMNIRDGSPGWLADVIENRYCKAYRRAYKTNAAASFTIETRWYLKQLRESAAEEGRKYASKIR